MDLEVVGRHALLFDDDANAAFVNSNDALVVWHSLQIDRYDVRHLLSTPPPPRRRNRYSERIIFDDPILESQLDQERYVDLHIHSGVEENGVPGEKVGYHAFAFSYGESDGFADQKKKAVIEHSGFLPPFRIPENLLQSLPSTEKEHQIIARTAMFVSNHGGQSEIILRVKQGDNPTFGFLMPEHRLYPYFRFLVEHPELSQSGQYEVKTVDSKHCDASVIGESLSLLGSAYGNVEEEDGDDDTEIKKQFSGDRNHAVNCSVSCGSMHIEKNADVMKDQSVPRNIFPSIKDKVLSLKKKTAVSASKPEDFKSIKKENKAGSFSAVAENVRCKPWGIPSRIEPIILEPTPEFKSLIEKTVEFIMKKGKQFEETLMEQDMKHGKFSFLRPSDQYHPYYLKVLSTSQELKASGKCSYSGKDDLLGIGMDRKGSISKKIDVSFLDPYESDMKEKFKMVIGKSRKEAHNSQSKGLQPESGINVDAAVAASILQSAIRGVNKANRSKDNQHTSRSHLPFERENADQNGSSRTSSEADCKSDYVDVHLTEEQKVKAERLKRAKLFVSMLKSGAIPSKSSTVNDSSINPIESGVSRSASEVKFTDKAREHSYGPDVEMPVTVEEPERTCFGEEHNERLARRKYRSRSIDFVDDAEVNVGDKKKHIVVDPKTENRSRSQRQAEEDDNRITEGRKQKHYRRRRNSASEENESERGSDAEDRKKFAKSRHLSHCPQLEDDGEHEYTDKERGTRKKHRSHYSSGKKGYSRRKCSDEEEEYNIDRRDHKRSRKKHRSHRTLKHNEDKRSHRQRHCSRGKDSRHNVAHESSSDTLNRNQCSLDKCKMELYNERGELEEGEISSKVSGESRENACGLVARETSIDVISHARDSSQPPETIASVPDDLRAKIRAILMATRL